MFATFRTLFLPPYPTAALCCTMTQEVQDEFGESLESAQAWMLAVQERLKVNDNTQGPRAALEARLRETEVRNTPQGVWM